MANKNHLCRHFCSAEQADELSMSTSRQPILTAIRNLMLVSTTVAILAIWLDTAIIKIIHSHLTPSLNELFNDASEVANAKFFVIVALSVYGASLVTMALPATRRWRLLSERAKRGSLLMLLTLLTGGLVTLVLKHVVARARPSMLLEHAHYGTATPFAGFPFNSFPSSHAFTAFAVACVLAHLIPKWRTPLLVFAAIAGLCRVLTLEHFPSDVLASGFIAAWCVSFWAPRIQGSRS